MKRFAMLLCAIFFSGASMGAAHAVTTSFDFETLAPGAVAGNATTLTKNGVSLTFSSSNLAVAQLNYDFFFTYGFNNFLRSNSYTSPLTVELDRDASVVSFLNPVNGSVTGEIDTLSFEAFDSANNLLVSGASSAEIISFNATGIRKFVVAAPVTGFVLGPVTVETVPGVPAPAALPLMAAVIGAFGAVHHRRRRKT